MPIKPSNLISLNVTELSNTKSFWGGLGAIGIGIGLFLITEGVTTKPEMVGMISLLVMGGLNAIFQRDSQLKG